MTDSECAVFTSACSKKVADDSGACVM